MTTTATQSDVQFAVGDFVQVNPEFIAAKDRNRVFKVVKQPVGARGVNYTLEQVGSTLATKCPGYALMPFTGDVSAIVAAAEATPEVYLGSLVRVKGGAKGSPADQMYVVTKVSPGKANIAVLGGNDNRYFANVALTRLTVVDPSTVLA